ncbi:MAG: thiamine phosphate synthase [Acidobacteria bacterium]|nr:thiamine phosphate synthase [Acidobacteriota bacterium]
MSLPRPFPALYCIVDAPRFGSLAQMLLFCRECVAGGASLIQYRNKSGKSGEMLSHARELHRIAGPGVMLIMNDRADLCLGAALDGVHLGQDDLSPLAARRLVGERIVGLSTHTVEQVRAADAAHCDYIAIGPVFSTTSKQNPDPVIGTAGVKAARAATRKPLVAIGGITRSNCREVMAAGADSVAVISDLLINPREAVRGFLSLLGSVSPA